MSELYLHWVVLTKLKTKLNFQAQQQLLQAQSQQPLGAAQAYGSGIMGLISGYPGQTTKQFNLHLVHYKLY
jgi:hypothetical protein